MAGNKKQQGMRLALTLFIPYDPNKPETVSEASKQAAAIAEGYTKSENVILEKHAITAASISVPTPSTGEWG